MKFAAFGWLFRFSREERFGSLIALSLLIAMTKKTTFALLLILTFTVAATAQSVYSPEKDSAERKAILAVLRVPVEKDYKQKIVFVVDDLNSNGTWAFLGGRPQTPDGEAPDRTGTKFEGWEDAYDNNVFALFRKSSGKWRVVTYMIGCTDVCYLDWWREFKAPKAIFPHTE